MRTRACMPRAAAWLTLALAATALPGAEEGEPVRCISIRQINRTEVIDDRTIVFHMRGSAIYVNRLDRSCPNLDRNQPFSYRTSTGQICAVDAVTVLEDQGFGTRRGASCGLGEFEPIDEEALELLKGEQAPADITVEEIEVEQ